MQVNTASQWMKMIPSNVIHLQSSDAVLATYFTSVQCSISLQFELNSIAQQCNRFLPSSYFYTIYTQRERIREEFLIFFIYFDLYIFDILSIAYLCDHAIYTNIFVSILLPKWLVGLPYLFHQPYYFYDMTLQTILVICYSQYNIIDAMFLLQLNLQSVCQLHLSLPSYFFELWIITNPKYAH